MLVAEPLACVSTDTFLYKLGSEGSKVPANAFNWLVQCRLVISEARFDFQFGQKCQLILIFTTLINLKYDHRPSMIYFLPKFYGIKFTGSLDWQFQFFLRPESQVGNIVAYTLYFPYIFSYQVPFMCLYPSHPFMSHTPAHLSYVSNPSSYLVSHVSGTLPSISLPSWLG